MDYQNIINNIDLDSLPTEDELLLDELNTINTEPILDIPSIYPTAIATSQHQLFINTTPTKLLTLIRQQENKYLQQILTQTKKLENTLAVITPSGIINVLDSSTYNQTIEDHDLLKQTNTNNLNNTGTNNNNPPPLSSLRLFDVNTRDTRNLLRMVDILPDPSHDHSIDDIQEIANYFKISFDIVFEPRFVNASKDLMTRQNDNTIIAFEELNLNPFDLISDLRPLRWSRNFLRFQAGLRRALESHPFPHPDAAHQQQKNTSNYIRPCMSCWVKSVHDGRMQYQDPVELVWQMVEPLFSKHGEPNEFYSITSQLAMQNDFCEFMLDYDRYTVREMNTIDNTTQQQQEQHSANNNNNIDEGQITENFDISLFSALLSYNNISIFDTLLIKLQQCYGGVRTSLLYDLIEARRFDLFMAITNNLQKFSNQQVNNITNNTQPHGLSINVLINTIKSEFGDLLTQKYFQPQEICDKYININIIDIHNTLPHVAHKGNNSNNSNGVYIDNIINLLERFVDQEKCFTNQSSSQQEQQQEQQQPPTISFVLYKFFYNFNIVIQLRDDSKINEKEQPSTTTATTSATATTTPNHNNLPNDIYSKYPNAATYLAAEYPNVKPFVNISCRNSIAYHSIRNLYCYALEDKRVFTSSQYYRLRTEIEDDTMVDIDPESGEMIHLLPNQSLLHTNPLQPPKGKKQLILQNQFLSTAYVAPIINKYCWLIDILNDIPYHMLIQYIEHNIYDFKEIFKTIPFHHIYTILIHQSVEYIGKWLYLVMQYTPNLFHSEVFLFDFSPYQQELLCHQNNNSPITGQQQRSRQPSLNERIITAYIPQYHQDEVITTPKQMLFVLVVSFLTYIYRYIGSYPYYPSTIERYHNKSLGAAAPGCAISFTNKVLPDLMNIDRYPLYLEYAAQSLPSLSSPSSSSLPSVDAPTVAEVHLGRCPDMCFRKLGEIIQFCAHTDVFFTNNPFTRIQQQNNNNPNTDNSIDSSTSLQPPPPPSSSSSSSSSQSSNIDIHNSNSDSIDSMNNNQLLDNYEYSGDYYFSRKHHYLEQYYKHHISPPIPPGYIPPITIQTEQNISDNHKSNVDDVTSYDDNKNHNNDNNNNIMSPFQFDNNTTFNNLLYNIHYWEYITASLFLPYSSQLDNVNVDSNNNGNNNNHNNTDKKIIKKSLLPIDFTFVFFATICNQDDYYFNQLIMDRLQWQWFSHAAGLTQLPFISKLPHQTSFHVHIMCFLQEIICYTPYLQLGNNRPKVLLHNHSDNIVKILFFIAVHQQYTLSIPSNIMTLLTTTFNNNHLYQQNDNNNNTNNSHDDDDDDNNHVENITNLTTANPVTRQHVTQYIANLEHNSRVSIPTLENIDTFQKRVLLFRVSLSELSGRDIINDQLTLGMM